MGSTIITKTERPLRSIHDYGQSIWLDYIRRSLIASGELKRLIEDDGLRGVTSNPAIFEKAIAGSTDYSDILSSPDAAAMDARSLYEQIAIRDVQSAADLLYPVYQESKYRDGYVSLEVSPLLSHDTSGTLLEARRLWTLVNRDNAMIKVPATREGIPAVRQLIASGINVNVTLLFAQSAYEQVAEAYIAGLEERLGRRDNIDRIASVASFFISRIDSAVDGILTAKIKEAPEGEARKLCAMLGRAAIANAKLVYQRFLAFVASPRWRRLAENGAQSQRLLWASTGTKNPNYRDVMYVEELIGPETVNTIPPATFNSFRDHGQLRSSLTEDIESAYDLIESLAKAGVSMPKVTEALLQEGIQQFVEAFDKLLQVTGQHAGVGRAAKINRQSFKLPAALLDDVAASLDDWQKTNKAARLWQGDASLWTGADENRWLGWLGVTDHQLAHLQHLTNVVEEMKSAKLRHALLLGMGGSSLCPEVLRFTFGTVQGFPELHILDSTDPAQIRAIEGRIDLESTIFIVSSKSGGTLEPNILKQYFFERLKERVGQEEAGSRFIAITDPGSKMQHVAEADGFRQVFFGLPTIGGRYSALSDFGMVPAAIAGIDVTKFLGYADEMVHACAPTVPIQENPGIVLGTVLGVLANQGHDKVTIFASPGIRDLGAWLEQLLAESTGKDGKGLIPVDRELIGPPEIYGDDRVFVYLRLESGPSQAQDAAVAALEGGGHPVVRIAIPDVYQLGEEFFRWEIATAVAGAIIGVNPFNQPDVEASKIVTRKLTSQYEESGKLPPEIPIFEGDGIRLVADPRNAEALNDAVGAKKSVSAYLKAHVDRLQAGDYFAVLAYLEMNERNEELLQGIRHSVRDTKKVATCLGFGPRFLHSTGQAYKGGPNSGVFLQITCDDATDLRVPHQKYTFGVVKATQARGDFQVLADRQRRALRVHLGKDLGAGLKTLLGVLQQAE